MAGSALTVRLVGDDLDDERRRALAAGLARRLSRAGDFAVAEAAGEPVEGARGDLATVGALLVEWAQVYGPLVAAGAAGALGERIVGALVVTVQGWLRDAGPEVTEVVVDTGDGTRLTVTPNGADAEEVRAVVDAYAARLESEAP
ncbi:MAG: hypothetical protein ACLFU0_11725 [Alphaproteobacteria bacterium]